MPSTAFIPLRTCADDASVGTIAAQNWNGLVFSALTGSEVQADDGTYGGFATGSTAVTHYIKCTNADWASQSIPSNAVPTGYEIQVVRIRGAASFAVNSTAVRLVKGGTVSGSNFGTSGDYATAGDETTTYGSSTQLGGLSFTLAEATASDTGVALSITYNSGHAGTDPGGLFDQISIKLHYTVPDASVSRAMQILCGVCGFRM